eukprot:IDg13623t1
MDSAMIVSSRNDCLEQVLSLPVDLLPYLLHD